MTRSETDRLSQPKGSVCTTKSSRTLTPGMIMKRLRAARLTMVRATASGSRSPATRFTARVVEET